MSSAQADFLRFAFPPRWHYDVLRGLDHFQAVSARRDERLTDGIDVVRRHQRADGRWPRQHRYKGRAYFELEKLGAPSRWNTLRALRVLKWWERCFLIDVSITSTWRGRRGQSRPVRGCPSDP